MAQKQRLFTGFDVALVAVVLLAAFAWFFILNRPAEVAETAFEGSHARYFIEVPNLTPEQVATVSVGARIQEGSRHVPMGQVVHIETRPFTVRLEDDETQTITWGEVEGRVSMILTVETEVHVTDRDILAEGQLVLKGGESIGFTGPGFAFAQAIVLGWARGEQ
ncbi:MAG: DUF4330 domain-containing protein [Oscillospiraceae bacterium]|nr:DUF4330 domain-containing protein [Oscillospiraceae bacterium]